MSEVTAGQATLVGREAARADLRTALDAVERGSGTVMLVHGDAGMGKSRLVREALGERALTVLWGTTYPLDRELAYAPVVAALTAHLDRQSPLRRQQLTADLDALGTIMGGYGWSPPPSVEPAIDRIRRAEAVRRLLERIAELGPTVLVIDDLQWADTATLGVIQRVVHALDARPLLLIAIYRPDELGEARTLVSRLRRVPGARELAVGPLADADAAELLQRWSGGSMPSRDEQELVRRAGGNPLFVEALAREWAVDRRVPARPPAVAADLLLARLEGVDESTRAVLDVLAVAGAPIPLSAVARVLDRPDAPVEAAAIRLEGLGLANSGTDGQLSVAHPLVLEAAYHVVPPLRRQRLHAAVAGELAGSQPDLGVRARHMRLAGPQVDPGEAIPVLEAAGERAVIRLAGREAVAHLTAAVDLARVHAPGRLPRLLELLALGWHAQHEMGATTTVLDDAIAAARRAEDVAVEARCHQLHAVIHWYANRPEQARAAHARARALAVDHDDPVTRAALLFREAHQGFTDTDTEATADAVDGLRRLADFTGLRLVERAAHLGAAWVAQLEGRLPDVILHAGRCIDVDDADPVASPALQTLVPRAHAARAMANAALGRPAAVREDVAASVTAASEPLAAWRTHLAAFGVACEAGSVEDIETVLDDLRGSLATATRNETAAVLALLAGWSALARGDLDSAQVAIEDSRAATPAGGAHRSMPRAIADLSCALAVLAGTEAPAGAAQPPAAPWATPPWGHEARLLLALAGHDVGDVAGIRQQLASMGPAGDLPDLMLQRADALAVRQARPAEAGVRLAAVADQADVRGLRRRAARAWVEAAELLADEGRATTAARRGLQLAEQLGAVTIADRARRALRGRGIRVARPTAVADPLTARQRDVAALVAEGLTNAEIADRLFISVRTVTTHLDNVYTALGIRSRAQLATWWAGRDT